MGVNNLYDQIDLNILIKYLTRFNNLKIKLNK